MAAVSDRLDDPLPHESDLSSAETPPAFLEHIVMPEDTLIGLCLRYKVTAQELRKLNGFVGEHFRLCRTLAIPNKRQITQAVQPMTDSVKAKKFQNATGLGREESVFYLKSNAWDYDEALKEYREDDAWDFEQVTGTGDLALARDYFVAEDGSIEMETCEDSYMTPLLAGGRYPSNLRF